MAGAAVLGRLTWRVADVVAVQAETATARTLVLDVPGWAGHLPGQHVDLRLTAADGYSTQRSFSIANAPGGARVELTVQRVTGGEVSGYLVDEVRVGDQIELRGPVGGYFVWRPEWTEPVLLLAGGSGVVPLMAIARTRAARSAAVESATVGSGAVGSGTVGSGAVGSGAVGFGAVGSGAAPMRLIYSVRGPDDVIYAAELRRLAGEGTLAVHYAYTRAAPAGQPARIGRVDAGTVAESGWPADTGPLCYVCGPTAFVEAVADLLVAAGHPPPRIRTERFG
jgi:ferredoxin-NADP reductase